jgi:hypothetical protein
LPFTLVLRYADFGPQVEAHELLGDEVYSWIGQRCADDPETGHRTCHVEQDDPNDEFDVRVVVYHHRSLAEVRAQYPTVPNHSEYRYVELSDALDYLDGQISSLDREISDDQEADEISPPLVELLQHLQATRSTLQAIL